MEQVTGGKGGNAMSRKIRYTDERLAMGERVTDFLPPPSALVKREPTTKVTLELTQSSLAFFKKQAKRARVPYQRMLRGLIDAYAKQYDVAV
jgi:hypothetical protein